MYHIYNEHTKRTLTDEYGNEITFHYKWTAEEYYLKYCVGMCNVIIKYIE